jgi:acyl-CoA synthetase (AMP-forming)/AMP-acid ligase II
MLQIFVEYGDSQRCASLRRVICSGEALPASLARRFYEKLPQANLYNLYGPTETTVDVTAYACRPDLEGNSVPIGRPISNTRVYVLDSFERPVPIGVAGEIYIGGVGVGRGYLNQRELTADRFLADPFSKEAGARMYRTGDLGRWLPDGNIEFLGRNDFQVKIRGFRIELEEIEARLLEQKGISEAVVVAREDVPGEKRLVAYYVAIKGDGAETNAEELRGRLSAQLPEYMVPAAYVRLEALPLTANGKLDRKALPAPDQEAFITRGYEPPEGEVEEALARIWEEVLKVERVGRHDNFFELGGHSLSAVQVISRVRVAFSTDLALGDVFTSPTIATFSERIVDTQLAQFSAEELSELLEHI